MLFPFRLADPGAPLAVLSGIGSKLSARAIGDRKNLVTYSVELGEGLAYLLAIWALLEAVFASGTRLARVADLVTPTGVAGKEAEALLEPLGTEVLPLALDVGVFGRAAQRITKGTPSWLWGRMPTFVPIPPPPPPNMPARKPRDDTLFEQVQRLLLERMETVQAQASAATESLRGYSEVLLSATNLRLQRWILRLTVAVVVLTLATVAVGVATLLHDSGARTIVQRKSH
jgi:hypothetical protein